MSGVSPPTSFLRLLRAHASAVSVAFTGGLLLLVRETQQHGHDWSELVVGEHIRTVLSHQLRLIPAYALLALAAAVVTWPLFRRYALSRMRLWVAVFAADLVLLALSLGPFFDRTPGQLSAVAAALTPIFPNLDLHDLYRWHVLTAMSVGFWVVVSLAAAHYLWQWWASVGSSSGWSRALRLSPLLAAALAAVGALWPAPEPAAAGPRNVLIIASDSLRHDRLGVHGYHRKDISPHIDAFAAEATDLSGMHVATASTLESWASFLTGRFPPSHGLRYMYATKEQVRRVEEMPDRLPHLLTERGYHTAVVSDWAGNCFDLVDMGFASHQVGKVQNFDALLAELTLRAHLLYPMFFSNSLGELLFPEIRRTTLYARPASLTQTLMQEIDTAREAGRPFFAIHFSSGTHIPYRSRAPFNTRYVEEGYDGPHKYGIEVRAHDLISTGFEPKIPARVRQHISNLYDGAVAQFDAEVGDILAELRRRDLMDNTIVIVTSDHGEDLYDPGSTLGHGTNFWGGDQSTLIPFFIRAPGVTREGAVVDAITRNIDLSPTLLSLLGMPESEGYEGVDLTPLLTGEDDDLDLVAFAETCYLFFPKHRARAQFSDAEREDLLRVPGAKSTLEVDPDFDNNMVLKPRFRQGVVDAKDRMVRTRRWKLVHIPGKTAPILRLFDMQEDPGQTRDLSRASLSVMPELERLAQRYWSGEAGDLRWTIEAEALRPSATLAVAEDPQP